MSIDELVTGFEELTLPKERWTHAAHLTVALTYLKRYPRDEATSRMRDRIKRYNASVGGAPDGYHETITLGWLAVIESFLRQHDRAQTLEELRDLLVAFGCKDRLFEHWSRDLLLSPAARADWISPDRRAI
jgi:hypothetical protein